MRTGRTTCITYYYIPTQYIHRRIEFLYFFDIFSRKNIIYVVPRYIVTVSARFNPYAYIVYLSVRKSFVLIFRACRWQIYCYNVIEQSLFLSVFYASHKSNMVCSYTINITYSLACNQSFLRTYLSYTVSDVNSFSSWYYYFCYDTYTAYTA